MSAGFDPADPFKQWRDEFPRLADLGTWLLRSPNRSLTSGHYNDEMARDLARALTCASANYVEAYKATLASRPPIIINMKPKDDSE